MESLQARVSTFLNQKSKSSTRTWPHPSTFVATPESLADAGFFFKPSKEDPDNVRCFMCKKELGGWDEEDNPFEIHLTKCPKCPWAVARCSLEFDVDSNGNFLLKDSARLPSNKALEKARADTFGGKKWWPHDSVKNHGATSKKMAQAGFVYTPLSEGDDTATCFYCDLALSGWEAEDDPTEEHSKRVERSGKPCPFFEAVERHASSKTATAKSRKSRAAKHASPESDESEPEPAPLKASTKKEKQSEAATSSTALKNSAAIEDDDSEELLEEDDDPSLKVKPKPKSKPTPAPRKSSRKPASKSKLKSKPASKASGRAKHTMSALEEEAEAEASDGEAEPEPSRSRTKSGKEKKEKEVVKGKEKDNNKPPSNVDGKITTTKSYKEYSVDIDDDDDDVEVDVEGMRKGRGKREKEKKEGSKAHSRSTSKPRSTDDDKSRKKSSSSLANSQSRPLVRAASRPRVSEIAEVEEDERETEKLLDEASSGPELEPEPEEKPASKARKMKKVLALAENVEDELRQKATPGISVVSKKSAQSERASGKKADTKAGAPSSNSSMKKKAMKARSKEQGPDSTKSSKSSQQLEQDDVDNVDDYMDFPDNVADAAARDMDVDEPFEPEVPKKQAEMDTEMGDYDDFVPNRTSFPSQAHASDSKTAKPPNPKPKSKSNSKANFDASEEPGRPQTPGLVSSDSVEKAAKPPSVKGHTSTLKPGFGKHRDKPASQRSEGYASRMEVDGESENKAPGSQNKDRVDEVSAPVRAIVPLLATTKSKPKHTSPPAPAQISRPTTPEAQIVRLGPSKATHDDASNSDFQSALQVPPSPADLFLPALASAPFETVAALTDAERSMTVEQWIRHEMGVQYGRLKEDGERRIRAFLEQAEETRRQIEAL